MRPVGRAFESIGEFVKLNRVGAWIEVDDGVSADTRVEDKIIVARSTHRHRNGLVYIRAWVLRVGDAHVIRLSYSLVGRNLIWSLSSENCQPTDASPLFALAGWSEKVPI